MVNNKNRQEEQRHSVSVYAPNQRLYLREERHVSVWYHGFETTNPTRSLGPCLLIPNLGRLTNTPPLYSCWRSKKIAWFVSAYDNETRRPCGHLRVTCCGFSLQAMLCYLINKQQGYPIIARYPGPNMLRFRFSNDVLRRQAPALHFQVSPLQYIPTFPFRWCIQPTSNNQAPHSATEYFKTNMSRSSF